MLGPMVNPGFPKKQLVGVYSLELARLYNYLYQQSDKQFAIVHSLDGYDEVSLTTDVKVIMNGIEKIVSPESLGFSRVEVEDLKGGNTVKEAAKIFSDVLDRKWYQGTANDCISKQCSCFAVLLSAEIHEECVQMAQESIQSGKAFRSFTRLIEMQS